MTNRALLIPRPIVRTSLPADTNLVLPLAAANSTKTRCLIHSRTSDFRTEQPRHRGCHPNGHLQRPICRSKRHSHAIIRRKRESAAVGVKAGGGGGALLPAILTILTRASSSLLFPTRVTPPADAPIVTVQSTLARFEGPISKSWHRIASRREPRPGQQKPGIRDRPSRHR